MVENVRFYKAFCDSGGYARVRYASVRYIQTLRLRSLSFSKVALCKGALYPNAEIEINFGENSASGGFPFVFP